MLSKWLANVAGEQRWAFPLAMLAMYGSEQWQSPLLAVAGVTTLLIFLREHSWWRQLLVWLALTILWTVAFGHLAPFIPASQWFVTVASGFLIAQIPYLIDRWLSSRLPLTISALLFPAAIVSADFVRHLLDPTGSYGMLGYSVGADVIVARWASVFGVDGISFMLAWSATLLATVYQHRDWRAQRRALCGYLAAIAALTLFSVLPTHSVSTSSSRVNVALISNSNNEQRDLGWWLQQSQHAAEQGAQLIIWGEGALWIDQRDENAAIERVQTLARTQQVDIVAAIFHRDQVFDHKRHNKLLWIDVNGHLRATYHKNHGQFAERTIAGDGQMAVVDTKWGRIGLSICWDADFPRFMRQASHKNVAAIINPSFDYAGVADARADMARFRAIENGVTLIRPNNFGWSLIANQHGRTLTQQWLNRGDTATLLYTLPLTARTTVYRFVGDGFLWACVAALLLLLMLGLRREIIEKKTTLIDSGAVP